MIKEIKIEKINIYNGLLNEKMYTPEDITSQCTMPLIDNGRLDTTLDASYIEMLNGDKHALQPSTRIIFRIKDEFGNTENIYRLIDKDSVINIVKGKKPLYKHTIQLVEPTKALERETCDNLDFTNYLAESYGTNKDIPFGITYQYLHSDYKWTTMGYANGNRFKGPYKILNEDVSQNYINIDVRMNIRCKSTFLGITMDKGTLSLTSFTITDPDGNVINVSGSQFQYSKTGRYTIKQEYKYYSSDNYNALPIAVMRYIWYFSVVNSFDDVPQEYNIKEVCERTLNNYKMHRINEERRFILDPNFNAEIAKSLSPEFSINGKTLFEALQEIGHFFHGIPKLLPNTHEETATDEDGNTTTYTNDWSSWNKVSFDLLGKQDFSIKGLNTSIYENQYSLDDFASSFVSYLQNATHTNYNASSSVTEPFIGGFVSSRTESSNFEISNDECIIKTSLPIRKVLSLKVYSNGTEIDITDRVAEMSKYNTLSTYTNEGNPYLNKAFFLCYTKGTKNIKGLTYKRNNQHALEGFTLEKAIHNIIATFNGKSIEGYYKNLAFKIEYIPYQDVKIRAYKPNQIAENEDYALYYNQSATEIDVEAYGENVKGLQISTGNRTITTTFYTESLAHIPPKGSKFGDFYAFDISREIRLNAPIKVTIQWSKDYNQISSNINIRRDERQFEISDEAHDRNVDYTEFCIIDTNLDISRFANAMTEEDVTRVHDELNSLGFATAEMLNAINARLSNIVENHEISFAIIKTVSTDETGKEATSCFLLPTSCFPFGNQVVLHFGTDDNYSAQTTSSNAEGEDSYNLEEYIPYVNTFGRFHTMSMILGSANPIKNFNNAITSNAKQLYKVNESELNFDSALINYWENGFDVDKGNKERLSCTLQLPFITHRKDLIIGSALSKSMPITGDNSTTFKYVVFTKTPNRYSSKVDDLLCVECNYPSITPNHDYKYIEIGATTALQNGVGYGIITNNNELVLYIDKPVKFGDELKPIYLMFRGKK